MTAPSAPDMSRDAVPLAEGLDGLMADLARLTEAAETVTLGDLVDRLGARGHGPILLVLSALLILPTGMIPMVPAAIGAGFLLTAIQMAVGGRGVSLPARFARLELPTAPLRRGLTRAAPLVARAGRLTHPRANVLVQGRLSLAAIALILALSGTAIIAIGAIPGLPFLLALPAAVFGLGLTAGDGRVVSAGFAMTAMAGAAVLALI